jgi:hypothetical protein
LIPRQKIVEVAFQKLLKFLVLICTCKSWQFLRDPILHHIYVTHIDLATFSFAKRIASVL